MYREKKEEIKERRTKEEQGRTNKKNSQEHMIKRKMKGEGGGTYEES